MGVLGFTKTLSHEGKRKGIYTNAIAPVAGTAMTETVMPPQAVASLNPKYVSALVSYLSHEQCQDTGEVFEVGGGHISKLRLQRSKGLNFKNLDDVSPENISKQWDQVGEFENSEDPENGLVYPKEFPDTLAVISENIGVDLNYK